MLLTLLCFWVAMEDKLVTTSEHEQQQPIRCKGVCHNSWKLYISLLFIFLLFFKKNNIFICHSKLICLFICYVWIIFFFANFSGGLSQTRWATDYWGDICGATNAPWSSDSCYMYLFVSQRYHFLEDAGYHHSLFSLKDLDLFLF